MLPHPFHHAVAILLHLSADQQVAWTPRRLTEALGLPAERTRWVLKALADAGLVVVKGTGFGLGCRRISLETVMRAVEPLGEAACPAAEAAHQRLLNLAAERLGGIGLDELTTPKA